MLPPTKKKSLTLRALLTTFHGKVRYQSTQINLCKVESFGNWKRNTITFDLRRYDQI